MMNIYQKLAEARVKLQDTDIKKSGMNTFAKFQYYELKDFLPYILKIFAELGLCSVVSFTSERATLTIINSEKPEEKIDFSSPMPPLALENKKGVIETNNLIQTIGALETYQRRYLYLSALEISENDIVDSLDNTKAENNSKPLALEKFVIAINSINNLDELNNKWIESENWFASKQPELKEQAYQAFLERYSALGGS